MKIVIADDHPLFRQALIATLNTQFENIKIIEAESIPY